MSTKQMALCYLRSNMDCEELAYHILATSEEENYYLDCYAGSTEEEGDIEDWLHWVIG